MLLDGIPAPIVCHAFRALPSSSCPWALHSTVEDTYA